MKDNTTVNLNDMKYRYNVSLFNQKTRKFFSFTQSAIKLLVIQDDVFNPFTEGYMIFENNLDALHRSFKIEDEVIEAGFNFNENGRDHIFIEISPVISDSIVNGDVNSKVWTLRYLFTITNIETIEGDTPDSKFKKLYFVDYKKEIFSTKNIEFSTALLVDMDIPPSQRKDRDRSVKTGIALREIIRTTLGDNQIFDDDWDEGSEDIMYTSSPKNKAIDDLFYIYDKHQSEILSDFCILSTDRYTNEWKLEPFSSITQKALNKHDSTKAGEYQLERFTIAESGQSPIIPYSSRIPTDHNSFLSNIYTADYSKIESFTITDVNEEDVYDFLVTNVVIGYNPSNKQFNVTHQDISDTKNFFVENYVKNLKRSGFKNLDLFNVDDSRLQNQSIKYSYTPYNSVNKFYRGRNQVLKASYMLNLAIDFSSKGLTFRRSGKFFSIGKDSSFTPSEYENRLQGQWFCTNVEHVFTDRTYTNNISGVKLNKFY